MCKNWQDLVADLLGLGGDSSPTVRPENDEADHFNDGE